MDSTLHIIVMFDQGVDAPHSIAAYPIGSRGFEKAMFLIYDHSEALRNKRQDPSTRLWAEIGGQRWDHDNIVATSISYDAAHYPDKVEMITELIERFAPGFVETSESRLSHLDQVERDMFANISISSDRQIKYAQGLFLDDEHRQKCMTVLEACIREIDKPDVLASIKTVASYLLSQVPMCSVFWIERASSDEVRMAILEQINGNCAAFRPEKVIRLGAQLEISLSKWN